MRHTMHKLMCIHPSIHQDSSLRLSIGNVQLVHMWNHVAECQILWYTILLSGRLWGLWGLCRHVRQSLRRLKERLCSHPPSIAHPAVTIAYQILTLAPHHQCIRTYPHIQPNQGGVFTMRSVFHTRMRATSPRGPRDMYNAPLYSYPNVMRDRYGWLFSPGLAS